LEKSIRLDRNESFKAQLVKDDDDDDDDDGDDDDVNDDDVDQITFLGI
jgi:hypothetical protein